MPKRQRQRIDQSGEQLAMPLSAIMGDLVPQLPERGMVAQSPALRYCPALESDCGQKECKDECALVAAGWKIYGANHDR